VLVVHIARVLSRPLELRDSQCRTDAIVVLGAPCDFRGEITDVGRERVEDAISLWRQQVAPIVVFTGKGSHPERAEAEVMAAYARSKGLPEQAIALELLSQTTRENAAQALAMLSDLGSVWVVSQPFHLRRARRAFQRLGVRAFARADPSSMQYRAGARALKWIVREYAAWARELHR